jgi:hypothetical protein
MFQRCGCMKRVWFSKFAYLDVRVPLMRSPLVTFSDHFLKRLLYRPARGPQKHPQWASDMQGRVIVCALAATAFGVRVGDLRNHAAPKRFSRRLCVDMLVGRLCALGDAHERGKWGIRSCGVPALFPYCAFGGAPPARRDPAARVLFSQDSLSLRWSSPSAPASETVHREPAHAATPGAVRIAAQRTGRTHRTDLR